MMILVIDNYDSFTYNLVHYLGELGVKTVVKRNDEVTVSETLQMHLKGIVLSPGPCDPKKAGICLDLVHGASAEIPILGVCLGHQAIGQSFGATIVRAKKPMHGKVSTINHDEAGLFANLPSSFKAIRYHSLVIERESLPNSLKITAETDDGIIMGIQHKILPVFGVQFHPESIETEFGHSLLSNFLDIVRIHGGNL